MSISITMDTSALAPVPQTGAPPADYGAAVVQLAQQVKALAEQAARKSEEGISLRETVSQVSNESATKLTPEEVAECFSRYSTAFGKGRKPSPEEPPTEEQLGAIRHLLRSNQSPAVDFAVFGPNGSRLYRR